MRLSPFALLLVWSATLPGHAATHEQWLVTTDFWGNPVYQTLELEVDGGRLSGRFDDDPL